MLLCSVVLPGVAHAAVNASSQIPELNPFCWKKRDCIEIRKYYELGSPSQKTLEEGFITGNTAAPCVGGVGEEEWGRCLPAGVSNTEISFGGQSKFANIGEFILLMYKYLVTVASIVAVIMIIIAGMQWITSGGNSEAISGAKHRIAGSVIGLFIAYMSYFILNTVNPALVNFRLPQVWLVRPQQLIPKFCREIKGAGTDKLKFVYYANYDDQRSEVDVKKASKDQLTYGTQKDGNNNPLFMCGRRFLADGAGTQACFGNLCPLSPEGDAQICTQDQEGQDMTCKRGDFALHLSIDVEAFDIEEQISQSLDRVNLGVFITKAMDTNWIYQTQVLRGVCKNGNTLYLANNGDAKEWNAGSRVFGPNGGSAGGIAKSPYWEYQYYYTDLINFQDVGWECRNGGEMVGYLLRIETAARQSVWNDFKSSLSPMSLVFPIYGVGKFANNLFGNASQPNLNIGYDRNTGKAVFGTFSDDVKSLNNYIPIEELKNGGLSLDVRLTIGKLVRMKGKSGETPKDFPENISPGILAE